jgi:hypothetical protein
VWRYEPKLDLFRGLLWRRDGTAIQLLSRRNVKDLSPWFSGRSGRAGDTMRFPSGAAYLPQRFVRWATFSLTETDGSGNRPRFFAGAQSDPRPIAD